MASGRSLTDLIPEVLDKRTFGIILQTAELRFRALEDQRAELQQLMTQLRAVALERINDVLTPAILSVQKVQEKGFLIARSSTAGELGDGNILTLIVDDLDERALFTPSPYVLLAREATADDWGVGRLIAWSAEDGELVCEVVSAEGEPGPHDDWVIGALAGATLAQVTMLVDATAARDAAVAAAGEVAEAAPGLLSAAATAVGAAGVASDAAGAALEAKADAEAAAASIDTAAINIRFDEIEGRTITGEGLAVGGGDLTASRTIDVPAASDGEGIAGVSTALAMTPAADRAALMAAVGPIIADVLTLAMRDADAVADQYGFAGGWADSFADAGGVDAAASTNEMFEGANRLISNTVYSAGAVDIAPVMTTNLSGGHVASSSSTAGGNDPYRAFDDNNSTGWAPNGGAPAWVSLRRVDGVGRVVTGLKLRIPVANYGPLAFSLQGSNNGSDWTTIQTYATGAWAANEERTFNVDQATWGVHAAMAYSYHRINVTTYGSSGFLQITEWSLYERQIAYGALDLISETLPLGFEPVEIAVAFLAKPTGGVLTPGTNLKAYASRDDGDHWTEAVPAVLTELAIGTLYLATVDVSGQPAGQDARWRIELPGVAFKTEILEVALRGKA